MQEYRLRATGIVPPPDPTITNHAREVEYSWDFP